MNLYKLHTDPQSLDLYEEANENLPEFFWDKYAKSPRELKKREKAISKSLKYSFKYAQSVLKGPFKLGEEIIATNAEYSFFYAKNMIKGLFKLGEEAISRDAEYSYSYARALVKGPFKQGEAAIAGGC